MNESSFISHFNTVLQEVRSRLSNLENEIGRLGRDHAGQIQVLKGEPGDISAATAAAAKQMHEERTAHAATINDTLAAIQQRQNEFINEIRSEIQGFKATALSTLERTVRDTVRELLVAGNVLDGNGKAHPSLKGEASTVAGPVGPVSTVPGPQGLPGRDSMSKQDIQDVIQSALDQFEATAFADMSLKARRDVEMYVESFKARLNSIRN